MKFCAVLLLCLKSLVCSAQDLTSIIDPSMMNSKIWTGNSDYNVDGHPFLIDSWCLGAVSTISGQKFLGVNVKLDTHRGVLLVKAGNVVNSVNKEMVEGFEFIFDSEDFYFQKTELGYVRIVYSDKSIVVVLPKKKLKEAQLSNGYNSTTKAVKDKLVEASLNYISIDDGRTWSKVTSKKDLYAILDTKKLERVSDNGKIRVKEIDDLVEVMRQYDSQ